MLNLSEGMEEAGVDAGHIVASTHMDRSGEMAGAGISLRPFEGAIVKLVN
jgi:hypothetical protein